MLLKNIKSTTRAKFICPCPRGIFINMNSVLNISNLNTIERYLKLIDSASNDEVLAPWLPQSKCHDLAKQLSHYLIFFFFFFPFLIDGRARQK